MTQPHLVKLNFQNMSELDKGRLGLVLKKHIETVQYDCVNRPSDSSGKPQTRSLLIQFDFVPQAETDEFGVIRCAGTVCEVTVKSKLPPHKSNPIRMLPGKDGFYFNPDFPNDPQQKSLLTGVPANGDDDESDE
jgi:hypothetical protein